MLAFLRLETVHPILVHVTLGVLPVIVLSYWMAAWRRSERWAFAGDVALGVGTVVTLATAAFGLVSNFILAWPGGIGFWRWMHLGFGALTLLLLLALASWRWRRFRAPVWSGAYRTFAAALVVAVVAGFTGWIGGEVLVYESGMAVRGGAEGALAPIPARADPAPRDLPDAMKHVRAAWAVVTTSLASMLVERPAGEHYEQIAEASRRLQRLADWVAANPMHEDDAQHAREQRRMAGVLKRVARELETGATAHDIDATASAAGELQTVCARCHADLRWHASGHGARRLTFRESDARGE